MQLRRQVFRYLPAVAMAMIVPAVIGVTPAF